MQPKHLLLVATLSVFCRPAQATVLWDLSLEERIARADGVFVGTVKEVKAVAAADGMIFTEATLDVQRTIYGEAQSTVTVTQFGGTIGDRTVSIAGTVPMKVGESLVVIVRRDRLGRLQLVSMGLGAFRVSGREARQHIDVPLMRRDGQMREPPGEARIAIDRIEAVARDVERTLARAPR